MQLIRLHFGHLPYGLWKIKSSNRSKGDYGKEQNENKDYKEGVIHASELILQKGVAFWGYDQKLCSALLNEENDLYDFVSEGEFDTTIYSIAIDGTSMYLTTADGLLCLPLDETEQEQSGAQVLDDHSFSNEDFEIYDGNIYFTYGTYLYRISEQGGETKKLEENIEHYQVTSEGIYCLNTDGDLLLVSLDGTERKTLHELDCTGGIFFYQNRAFIMTGKEDHFVYEYTPKTDTVNDISFENTLSPYHEIWVTEDFIYYESEDFKIYRYDLDTGAETLIEVEYDLPDHSYGYMDHATMYYVYSDYVYWIHLDNGESFKLHKNEALENSAPVSQNDQTANNAAMNPESTDSTYHIAEGLGVYNSEGQACLESKHFTLYLPADGDWAYRVMNNTAIELYYVPAYEAGFGGHLVTIQAYDWGDNSYEDDPNYAIAGLSENKKYIALFPTDVQYDANQAEGYTRMYEYVRRIDNSEGKEQNNPFSCY